MIFVKMSKIDVNMFDIFEKYGILLNICEWCLELLLK